MKAISHFILFILLLLSCSFYSQNEVWNPSFEDFDHSILPFSYPQPFDHQKLGYLPYNWNHRNSCDFYVEGYDDNSVFAHSGICGAGFAATGANGNANIPYREYVIGRTNPLIAGETYKIEFWVKRRNGNTPINVGAVLTTGDYACSPTGTACEILPFTPEASGIIAGNNYTYTKIVGFVVVGSSINYNVIIGNFNLTSVEGSENNYFYVDDVSVERCNVPGSPNPSIEMTANVFCENDPIIADGTNSTNIDCYKWELYSGNTLLNSTNWEVGQPSQINLNTLANLTRGNCYRVELKTIQACTEVPISKEFCIEDPEVVLTMNNDNPICENLPIHLITNGDANWSYQWSTGANGFGLSEIQTTSNVSTNNYAVNVTTTAGCTATSSIDVNVHENNNVAPYSTGIDNSSEFIYYMQANAGTYCFSIGSFDVLTENVVFEVTSPPPSEVSVSISNTSQESGTFCWTPDNPDIGSHTFNIKLTDNNKCQTMSNTFQVTINVVCEFCPLGIYYENRQPTNNPLPSETKAGKFIVAGEDVDPNQTNGPVETGNDAVTFQAGSYINLEPGFTAGTNFTTIIDPTTCIDECNDCCLTWSGFSFDFIPNVFTPNGDGYNDLWYIPDSQHPYCAYNAQGYDLKIFNRWGSLIYNRTESYSTECCPFKSPPALAHGTIYWDGTTNSGSYVSDGTYFYAFTLTGCSYSHNYSGSISLLGSNQTTANDDNSRLIPNDPILLDDEDLETYAVKGNNIVTESNSAQNTPTFSLEMYPNPTKEILNLSFNNPEYNGAIANIRNLEGKVLQTKVINKDKITFNVKALPNGVYLLEVLNNNAINYKSFFTKQ